MNRGEGSVLDIALDVCEATGTEAFAKIRIADAVRIEGSRISKELYRYALAAHFDVLVSKNNKAFLAVEFDGAGHDARNDRKKAEICDRFAIPMVRVKEVHLRAKQFEDTAVAFFIWQLFCVEEFLKKYGFDPYEPYDPAFFIAVEGKDRRWPFAYAERWRGKLVRPFKEVVHQFDATVRDSYAHGLLQFGTITFTYHRGLDYRSIYAQSVGKDRLVSGEADLNLEVYGLDPRRRELFGEIANFVEGLAAEQMYRHALLFLEGKKTAGSPETMEARVKEWKKEGFELKRAFNLPFDP